jgi:3-oxoacyl-[acyl-carrier protein] reductase
VLPVIDPGVQGRVVLVTGANNPHGIGAAVARAFAAQGAALFVHYYRPRAGTPQTGSTGEDEPGETFYAAQQTSDIAPLLAELQAQGIRAASMGADLADPGAIPALFAAAEAALGPVEVLVNNAAYWEADTFVPPQAPLASEHVEKWTARPQSLDLAALDRMFAVNTRAVAQSMAEFARRHVARGANWGRIINISTAGAYSFPSEVSYGASKLALEGYTRSAAAELGQFGITVNAIAPGPVQTGWITPELEAAILPSIPLGRIGTPADIADVVVFLASEQARWVSGQRLFAGGGHGM